MTDRTLLTGRHHVAALLAALPQLDTERLDEWGRVLGRVLVGGGRLLVAGNGGSAAQAQHLTAELVGRYRDDRPALSALALHAETSALTAIANDYGYDEAYARQVRAHGRPGDVLLALSTSGSSRNVLLAAAAARDGGLYCWALTGPAPNPLADAADEAVAVPAPTTATVQEVHQVALHVLCASVDVQVGAARPSSGFGERPDRPWPDGTADAAGAADPAGAAELAGAADLAGSRSRRRARRVAAAPAEADRSRATGPVGGPWEAR